MKKRRKKNDINSLNKEVTPRHKVELDGDDWAPPMAAPGRHIICQKPGDAFAAASEQKPRPLAALHHALLGDGVVEVPLTFNVMMTCMVEDEEELSFDAKVFIFLMALVLCKMR